MFIINFHKGKAYPFIPLPMHEITDCVVDGDQMLTKEILNLRDALLHLPTVAQKFSYAANYLTTCYIRKLTLNPFVDFAVNQIIRQPNSQTIKWIAGKTGYSHKHFINIFKNHTGLTPKAFLTVNRFQKAIQEIENRKSINWSAVAAETGYYDQAHFIAEFKGFSGFTPQQYLSLKTDQLNYVPVG